MQNSLSLALSPAYILKTVYGYDTFRPLQEEIIHKILAKQDTLAVMPTGGGKSLCYQVPALILPGLTIVVSPLIALMQDQVNFLQSSGVEALFLNSSLEWDTYRENMSRVRSGKIKLLYVAPETLVTERVQELLSSVQVDCITIDEAHCISEWGHDFRPEYRKISAIRALFPDAVCLALTATATAQVRTDIKKTLKLNNHAEFIASFDRKNIFLEVVPKQKPMQQVLNFLSRFPDQSGIIYCFSRKQVDDLASELQSHGLSALPYHAGLRDDVRASNQEQFLKDDVRIMVATLAFGMGINKPNVRFVIHHDLPKSLEQYYQEIGRAGRDGEPSHALLMYGQGDTRKIRFFLEEKSASEVRKAEIHLKGMTSYAEMTSCRRAALLGYFGEKYTRAQIPGAVTAEPAGFCCDVCSRGPVAESDVTVPAQKVLSCILRTGQRYGAAYIIDVLLGSRQKRITDNGHHKLSTWGIGCEMAKEEWSDLVRSLVEGGYLSKDDEYGVLSLTGEARTALSEREPILLAWNLAAAMGTYNKIEITTSSTPGTLKFPKKTKGGIDPSDGTGTRILASLKALRRGLAEAAAVPPYVIFSDRTLEDIAVKKPKDRGDLLDVYGIGEVKAERYGIFIMKAIREAE